MILATYCARICNLPVVEIDTQAARSVLQPLWNHAPEPTIALKEPRRGGPQDRPRTGAHRREPQESSPLGGPAERHRDGSVSGRHYSQSPSTRTVFEAFANTLPVGRIADEAEALRPAAFLSIGSRPQSR
jgi:hypothetical protein